MALLIPIFLFMLLELVLRVSHYGKDYSTFVRLPDQYPGLIFFNPDLPKKYFDDNVAVPSVIPDGFKDIKDKNTFRVFVLGGSTTAGFPYPTNASFPRQLKRKLQLLYPDKQFEIINMGVSAVNTTFMAQYIRDVLDQSPDLILIYAGHNEYYGAYGAAAAGLIKGDNPLLSWFFYLKEYKTYQLVENLIAYTARYFHDEAPSGSGKTLMAEMAGDRLVKHNSPEYKEGINQFRLNLEYILSECKSANVPVIIGTLTSNLLQKPLDSVTNPNSLSNKIFKSAEKISTTDSAGAYNLFVEAKEKDMLRFRAPAEMNKIIGGMRLRYGSTIADIDSLFKNKCEKGIPGYSIFVDHLHPNIYGHQLIANEYFNQIIERGLLSEPDNKNLWALSDKILKETFPFTRFDSTFADIKIRVLLNSFPFKKGYGTQIIFSNYKPSNYSDSLALQTAEGKISWTAGHTLLAEYYFSKQNYKAFFKEMMSIIFDKPFDTYTYKSTASYLIEAKQFVPAYTVVSLLHNVNPDIYTLKTMGHLSVNLGQYPRAEYFLKEALKLDASDPEVLYFLSLSQFYSGNFSESAKNVKACLRLNPNYSDARQLNEILLNR